VLFANGTRSPGPKLPVLVIGVLLPKEYCSVSLLFKTKKYEVGYKETSRASSAVLSFVPPLVLFSVLGRA